MLRILRTTVAGKSRSCRTPFSLSSARNLSSAAVTPTTHVARESAASAHPVPGSSFFFLRKFSSPDSSHQRHDGHHSSTHYPELSGSVVPETELAAHEALTTEHLSDDAEVLSSAREEDEALSASGSEHGHTDEDEEDLSAESGKDSTSDLVPESEEDTAIDMSNVPEDLKEMLEDSYELESGGEDLTPVGPLELLTLDEVKQVLEEVRARDVEIFPVQDRCEWTDLMVVATGISDRHVRGIADALVYKIKKKGIVESPLYPTIEGQVGGKWLVVDCGNIIIHVLNEESRAYYRLEDLWTGDVKPSTTDEDLEMMLRQAGLKDIVP